MHMRRFIRKASVVLISFAMAFSVMEAAPDTGLYAKTTESEESMTQQLEDLFTTIDLMDATIADLQREMTAGNVTSVRLSQMYIDRIRAYDEKLKLNSIITINPGALKDAEALDKERGNGKVRGPLHGIPVVVKANYDVAGMATSAGSNALATMIASEDSFAVKKLKEAGAVILAQANMSEFAYSAVDSKSTLGGTVHNAYDGSKTPAGSSGGTAVAVTCNFAAAGLGTDTGGSIRNPASFSDLYGIRPSKGLTSISGVVPLAASRDTTGPIARTAEDMALLLETIAGTDPADDFTVEADADKLVGNGYSDSLSVDSLKGMRIGYLEYSFSYPEFTDDGNDGTEDGNTEEDDNIVMHHPDEKVDAMLKRTLANLSKAGAEFVDLSKKLPSEECYKYYTGASDNTMEYDLNKFLHGKGKNAPCKTMKDIISSGKDVSYSYLDAYADDPSVLAGSFGKTENPYTKEINSFMRTETWQTALDGRAYVMEVLEKNDIDAVMYLTYFDEVPDLPVYESNWNVNYAGYQYVFAPAMGLPEISMPMGFSDADGEYTSEMPLGLSVFSGFGQEENLMKIAYAYEQQAGESIRRMPERTPALPDAELEGFLEELMDKVYSIDYSMYLAKPEGKVQLMLNAYDRAKNVNTKDPYAVYDVAKALARAYDNVISALVASGIDPDWVGHRYEKLSWEWKGVAAASAVFICADDSSHKKTVTAEIESRVAKEATLSAPGRKVYTAKVSLNGKEYSSTRNVPIYIYKKEWVDGLWYNSDGSQTYLPKMSWKKNKKGWWLEDTAGWYPVSRWQKVDGKWYYFDPEGYMASNEWVDGCWLGKNGSWSYKNKAEWKKYGDRWMYKTSDWYAKMGKQKIDGKWYYFDQNGYLVRNR